jgi:hypothetical protein
VPALTWLDFVCFFWHHTVANQSAFAHTVTAAQQGHKGAPQSQDQGGGQKSPNPFPALRFMLFVLRSPTPLPVLGFFLCDCQPCAKSSANPYPPSAIYAQLSEHPSASCTPHALCPPMVLCFWGTRKPQKERYSHCGAADASPKYHLSTPCYAVRPLPDPPGMGLLISESLAPPTLWAHRPPEQTLRPTPGLASTAFHKPG